jgi:hypothetical protein
VSNPTTKEMIQFLESTHSYTSIVSDSKKWLSVTTVVGAMKPKFDAQVQAPKSSRNTKSKWYGMKPEDIIAAWDAEGKRSTDLGHWYHSRIEEQMLAQDSIDGLPVHRPIIQGEYKQAPKQKLEEGIYPEHMVYLDSVGICGQSDIVKVQEGFVDIIDHKTSKEIRRKGYTNWEGVTTKMLKPVQHLDECEFNHYALQLSIYMYCILRHNPMLLPGKMIINHVKFVQNGIDQYGYPVVLLENGEPVVETIAPIVVPYMSKEVQSIITWLKDDKNRQSLIKH